MQPHLNISFPIGSKQCTQLCSTFSQKHILHFVSSIYSTSLEYGFHVTLVPDRDWMSTHHFSLLITIYYNAIEFDDMFRVQVRNISILKYCHVQFRGQLSKQCGMLSALNLQGSSNLL